MAARHFIVLVLLSPAAAFAPGSARGRSLLARQATEPGEGSPFVRLPPSSDGASSSVPLPPLPDLAASSAPPAAGASPEQAAADARSAIQERARALGLEEAPGPETFSAPAAPAAPAAEVVVDVPAEAPAEALPPNAVVFDKARHASFDYDAERDAAEAVVRVVSQLKRFGVDKGDGDKLGALAAACEALGALSEASPAPALRDDPRLLGDWELVGTTSEEMAKRRGMTGLGAVPFTSPAAIFFRFNPDGSCVAKEVLQFFGQPVMLNELRGRFGFNPDGRVMQEKYQGGDCDVGGQKNNPGFGGATATLANLCITADGALRLGCTPGADPRYFVFKKLEEGELDGWLAQKKLPLDGGTVMG